MENMKKERILHIQEHERHLGLLQPFADRIAVGEDLSDTSAGKFTRLLQNFEQHRLEFAQFRHDVRCSANASDILGPISQDQQQSADRRRKLREHVLGARDAFQKRRNAFVPVSAATGDVFNDADTNMEDLPILRHRLEARLLRVQQSELIKISELSGLQERNTDNFEKEETEVKNVRTETKGLSKRRQIKFAPAHEKLLAELVESLKSKATYDQIAARVNAEFGTAYTGKQCEEKWKRSLDPNLSKGTWTEQEDEWLLHLWKSYNGDIREIAATMGHRNVEQVRARLAILEFCLCE